MNYINKFKLTAHGPLLKARSPKRPKLTTVNTHYGE